MTELSQRIAIAQECGWTQIVDQSEAVMMPPGYSVVGYPPKDAIVGHKREIPEYLRDWNAMCAAIAALSDKDWTIFWYRIVAKLKALPSGEWAVGPTRWPTIEECAEAFLWTVGRWIDEKPFDTSQTPS